MRLPNQKVKELQAQTLDLHKKGFTTAQICNTLKITDKTVRKWLKPYKQAKAETQQMRTLLMKSINTHLANPKTTATEIKNLFGCLSELNRKTALYE